MNCDEARLLIGRAAEGTVDAPTDGTRHRALRRHLAACAACRDIRDAQRAVRNALAARLDREAPPEFATQVMVNLEPAGSWLDALDWRRWTFRRLAPVATALLLVAAAGLRTTGPADTPQPIEFADLVTAWGAEATMDGRPTFMLLSGVDVAADALLDAVLTADPDEPLAEAP